MRSRIPSSRALGPGAVFDFRTDFCHPSPMEAHPFGFRLQAQRPGGSKAIFDHSTMDLKVRLTLRSGVI